MGRFLAVLSAALALTACATAPVSLMPGAQSVRIAKGDPPQGYVSVGPIVAVDGHGCGGFGRTGSYQNVITRLRNEARSMGANYVEIYQLTPPHAAPLGLGCFDDQYQITGMAFKAP